MSHATDKPIRTLVVDDEPLARLLITRLLRGDPRFEVIGQSENGGQALDALRRMAPDLVFLDIEMPDLSGFEVLKRVEPGSIPYVVFVTAFDHYALQAFRVHALDYLLKPVELDQFSACLDRAESAIRQKDLTHLAERLLRLASAEGPRNKVRAEATASLTFHYQGRLVRLAPAEIIWVEAANQYAKLHASSETYLLSRSLSTLERDLPARTFLRVHRSTLVNLRFVQQVQPAAFGTYTIVLTTGARLRLARSRHRLLDRLLDAAKTSRPHKT